MICQKGSLSIHELQEADLPLLLKWLSDPQVLEFYEGRDQQFNTQKVRKKFLDRKDQVNRCIVHYKQKPIGYIQFYELDEGTKRDYGYRNDVVFGLDQFIGEEGWRGKGIGTKLIQTMTTYICEDYNVDRIVMDPQKSNRRAIKCYERCQFTKVKELPRHEFHEGEYRDCALMEYKPKSKKA